MEFLSTQPLWGLGLLGIVVLATQYSQLRRPGGWPWASTGLLSISVLLLLCALCRPFLKVSVDQVHVVFLIDISQSVDLDAIESAADDIEKGIAALRTGDSWTLALLGREVQYVSEISALRKMTQVWRTETTLDRQRSATPLARGLREVRFQFPATKGRRIVLYSDGICPEADLASNLEQLRRESIDLRWNRLEPLRRSESAVVGMRASTVRAFAGETVRFDIDIVANRPTSGNVRLVHDGIVVAQKAVPLSDDHVHTVSLDARATRDGATEWTGEFWTEDDHLAINNQWQCRVGVERQPQILVLHDPPEEMRAIKRALAEQEMDLVVRGVAGIPTTLQQMLEFDAITLSNIPASKWSSRQIDDLKSYVTDFGGGVVMLGSEHSFGLGGYHVTAVDKVVPLTSRFEKEKEKPTLALVLVMDKSGSMEGIPMELAKRAALSTAEVMGAEDTIAIVAFDGNPKVVCPMTEATNRNVIRDGVGKLEAGGGTNLLAALEVAQQMLADSPAKLRHVIALSDGQTQPGNYDGLIHQMSDLGITFSAVAMGDADRDLLKSLVRIGQGRYYEADRPENVPRIFTQETRQAARSAIEEEVAEAHVVSMSPLLAGFHEGELPLTSAYQHTEQQPNSQLLLETETGEPLLAVAPYGLGMAMAFASNWTESWGEEWLQWESCGAFWAQLLRGIIRRVDTTGIRIEEHSQDGVWRINVMRLDDNEQPVSGVRWSATAYDASGKSQEISVQEVGLGRYTLQLPVLDQEQKTLRLRDTATNRMQIISRNPEYPAEYRLGQATASQLADVSGLSPNSIRDGVPQGTVRKPVAYLFYLGSMVFLLASVYLRRI